MSQSGFFKARKVKHGSKDLEEEVNRRQGVIMPMEIARSGLLATIEIKQKLRFGALKESEEALFRNMKVLDDVMSEMEKELREAGGKTCGKSSWNGEGSKPKRGGRRMLLEVASPGRWHLDPKAQRQRWDPLASPWSASTGKARWRIKAPRTVQQAGRTRGKRWYGMIRRRRRILRPARRWRKTTTSLGGVGPRPERRERFDWVARTSQGQAYVRQEVQ